MQDKDKIIEALLRSKIEIIANRNERFAMIQDELQDLKEELNNQCKKDEKQISNFFNADG